MAGKTSRKSTKATNKTVAGRADGKPVLLSGGNPQIAKADGDAPVQAYIAAMPGWKSDVGRRIDDLIVRAVPNVRKAVRWNSPWYGVEDAGWFASYHVFTRYVKVTFLNGASLRPEPPGSGKGPGLALGRHLRGRAGRGADGDVGPAVGRPARLARLLKSDSRVETTGGREYPVMIEWLGVDHLFELSRTEAIAGFFTPLAIFAVFLLAQLILPARRVPGYVINPETGEPPQLPAERPSGVRDRADRVGVGL